MAELTWAKPEVEPKQKNNPNNSGERAKFLIGGLLILFAVGYLLISGTLSGARYFLTVDEVVNNPEYEGQTVRISGAVIGDTIEYDSENLLIDFTLVHIPPEFDDLAEVLHQAVNDPDATRLHIHIENEVMPDLLQHEAQAILTGELGDDGVFYATELLLKCPSRYEEGIPEQVSHPNEG